MNTNRGPRNGRSFKVAGAVVGAGAVAVLGVLAIGVERDGSGAVPLAGSGNAPTNTTYVQPNVTNMNVGATASTTTTPGAAPATPAASPAIKAGH